MATSVVTLARHSLAYYLKTGQYISPPTELPPELSVQAGTFVSLKKDGTLRGCIGTFSPTRPTVAEEIIHNAVSAGIADPRFSPVEGSEVDGLEISVDILSEPERIGAITDLDPQKYGVIVKKGGRRGLLLPMLEGVDTAEQQVRIAMSKAGIKAGEAIELYRFTVTRYN